ncbi:helix-turn-helix domain-containing protein [Lysobacter sp. yr284]|uniref:winged helix-turn-helix transcriptional regulator n=1 Tax=Lysobacter sp. yr284 TaxID=1761791 RepID=UPI000B81AA3C|nr:helix-turn-helix domain-containing protein [Lysobacter sp. yr284]
MSPISEEDACKTAFVMAIKDALNVVNGKWKLAIVCTMLRAPRRFNEMERLLKGLTPRMLARELNALEVSGVVTRVPGAALSRATHSYTLTEAGKQLENVIISMAEWGVQYRKLSAKNC